MLDWSANSKEFGQSNMTDTKNNTKITNAEITSEEGKRSLKNLQDALLHAEYSEMGNGDRKYTNNEILDKLVLPLLQDLRLQVRRIACLQIDKRSVEHWKNTASWLYNLVNLKSNRYQQQDWAWLYHSHSQVILQPSHSPWGTTRARTVHLPWWWCLSVSRTGMHVCYAGTMKLCAWYPSRHVSVDWRRVGRSVSLSVFRGSKSLGGPTFFCTSCAVCKKEQSTGSVWNERSPSSAMGVHNMLPSLSSADSVVCLPSGLV